MRRPRFLTHHGTGGWWFTLVAPNGETVLVSEQYGSRQAARKGIAAVKRYALAARIVED